MKPIKTILQSQRKMYDFDSQLGRKELDFAEAYREETYDGYIINLENQLGRKLNPDEKEDADLMYDELTFKYEQ